MKGKRVRFEDETWLALDALARDMKKGFDELTDEAFADLLKKHGRPKTLKEALAGKRSARASQRYCSTRIHRRREEASGSPQSTEVGLM